MKTLTICQPYAHLICLPESDDRMKRVENRRWPTSFRGRLAIHAGKSRQWIDMGTLPDPDCPSCRGIGFVDVDTGRPLLPGVGWSGMNMAAECGCGVPADETYGIPLSAMAFGAIVAVCKLVDCFRVETVRDEHTHEYGYGRPVVPEAAARRRPWLVGHQHVEGPWCFVLAEVEPLERPIPYRGAQGFFDVPDDVIAAAAKGGAPC